MPATKSFSNSLKMVIKLKSLIIAGFNHLKAMLIFSTLVFKGLVKPGTTRLHMLFGNKFTITGGF